MKRIRVAVVGAGHLGRIHAKLLKANPMAKLAVVCDPQPRAQQAAIAEFDVRAVSDVRKVMDEFDAAVIATPSQQHFEIARDLIVAGKQLLIEKPLTVSVDEANELVQVARQHRAIVQVGHVERFNPTIEVALEQVGTPKFIQTNRFSGFTFRSTDIGVVHDLMIHDIDLVSSIFPGRLKTVQSSGVRLLGNHEDIAEARLEFECGGIARLTASRCSPTAERKIQMFGTRGFAEIDLTKMTVHVVKIPAWLAAGQVDFLSLTESQKTQVRDGLFRDVLLTEEFRVEPANAIQLEQTDWLQAIRDNTEPMITIEQGARNVAIADQISNQIVACSWNQTHDSLRAGNPLLKVVPEFLRTSVAETRAA